MGCQSSTKQYSNTLNPLSSKGDKHLNSPYKINLESNIKVTRIREIITNYYEALDCYTNSPYQLLKICAEKNIENIHTDTRV